MYQPPQFIAKERSQALDIIKAQLLLIDVGIGNNDDKAAARKQQAASNLLQRHRAMGV